MHLYILTHISVVCRWEGVGEKEVSARGEEVGKGWMLQSEFFFLFNFIVTKSLFLFECEMSVLWGILLSDYDNDDDD